MTVVILWLTIKRITCLVLHAMSLHPIQLPKKDTGTATVGLTTLPVFLAHMDRLAAWLHQWKHKAKCSC